MRNSNKNRRSSSKGSSSRGVTSKSRKPGSFKPDFKKASHKSREPEKKAFKINEHISPSLKAEIVTETREKITDWLEKAKKISETPHVPPESPMDELDPWQLEAVTGLLNEENIVVDAPTTAGKTRIVEAFFSAHVHDPGFRACYTTPVKSLANDKVKEFREMFGNENVGIATGDFKYNLSAPIVIATLETYRNSLLGVEPDLDRRLVVFDEYHYIMDVGRGTAWEEALILTPDNCQILLLSASIANPQDFVAWLNKLSKRQASLIQVKHRPVPLTDLVHFAGEWVDPSLIPEKYFKGLKRQAPLPMEHNKLAKNVSKLVDLSLTPCIVYGGKRIVCEHLAHEISKVLTPIELEHSERITAVLMATDRENKALSFIKPALRKMIQTYGVSFHHSGLTPPARVAIENLLKEGLLRFCTATSGLSLGINFSVRSALISDYARPSEEGVTPYGPSEVLQMLGRAGRRGKDAVGFSLWPDIKSYSKMGKPKREVCKSNLKNDPTTFLGLIGQGHDLKSIEKFYKKSLLWFQNSSVNLTLITPQRVMKKLEVDSIPCSSPAHEYVYWHDKKPESLCKECSFRKKCHPFLRAKSDGDLAKLHLHLQSIGALNHNEQLTAFGDIARYFPHAGGLLIARYIAEGKIKEKNLGEAIQLIAALATARFKKPRLSSSYRFPWKSEETEKELEKLYPLNLFIDLYDPPFGRRHHYVIKEFNPDAGYILKEWLTGISWQELLNKVTSERFGPGDVSNLIYRTASYLQAISQGQRNGPLKDSCCALRDELLRDPLSYQL